MDPEISWKNQIQKILELNGSGNFLIYFSVVRLFSHNIKTIE
jgi:hypothetical protein